MYFKTSEDASLANEAHESVFEALTLGKNICRKAGRTFSSESENVQFTATVYFSKLRHCFVKNVTWIATVRISELPFNNFMFVYAKSNMNCILWNFLYSFLPLTLLALAWRSCNYSGHLCSSSEFSCPIEKCVKMLLGHVKLLGWLSLRNQIY